MAAEPRDLDLVAEVFGREPARAVASIRELDRAGRVARAARLALPLLGGAILSLPIPGWHLAAVPGFLIAAVLLGVRRWREVSLIESVRGDCPACGGTAEYAVPRTARLPDTFPCPLCREFVQLREAR